jgi:hypothetical protein
MKNSDIRIGNYIGGGLEYDIDEEFPLGFWHKVRSIGNEDQEFEQIECETSESFEWVFKDNWCGIPLTETWLKAFGFDNKEYKQGYIGIACGSIDFVLTYPKIMGEWQTEFCWTFDSHKFVTIKYVHELQNLYFSLSQGKELEINEQ